MSKYQDIMNKIEVTDEMKSRILQNIEKELQDGADSDKAMSEGVKNAGAGESGNKIRRFELRKYMPMVAALVVFVISAFVVINVIPAKHANYSSSPMMDSAMTESATEAPMATESAAETEADYAMEAPMATEEAAEAYMETEEAAEAPREDTSAPMDSAKAVDKEGLAVNSGSSKTETAVTTSGTESANEALITQDQALEAIKKYCFENDPELESMMNSGDYTMYFDASVNDAGEIVVLYRSYTAAQIRYYINPTSGEVYVTELVPGIIDEEQKTDETFNIRDYMN